MPVHALQTYAEALAQYHLHPESKFLAANYCDWGTTQRRHIRVSGICHIGKEANELDRQQVLGIDANARPDYGFSDECVVEFRSELTTLVRVLGIGPTAKALGVTSRQLRSIIENSGGTDKATVRKIAVRLPVIMARAEKLNNERAHELQRLSQTIEELGLRGTARKVGADASNLRRKIMALKNFRRERLG